MSTRGTRFGSRARRRGHPASRVGRVTLVGGGPGAPDLITVRGMRALLRADVVITDRLGPTALLHELPADVEVIDVGKTPGHHPISQEAINVLLVEHALRGREVVRLKGGDPFLLGRGGEEVLACQSAGIPVEVVPGVTSAIAVPGAAGIPVTHRGSATGVHIVTGHVAAGPGLAGPSALGPVELTSLVDGSATVVVLMGVAALPAIAAQAIAAGVHPGTPVAIIEDGTLPTQRVTRTALSRAAADADAVGVRAPAVIVLGAVAALNLALPVPSQPAPDQRAPGGPVPARSPVGPSAA